MENTDIVLTATGSPAFCDLEVFVINIQREERAIIRQNLNEPIETLHIAPTQFSLLPGFYHKTLFLSISPLYLNNIAL